MEQCQMFDDDIEDDELDMLAYLHHQEERGRHSHLLANTQPRKHKCLFY
jgi:hypothetical protein